MATTINTEVRRLKVQSETEGNSCVLKLRRRGRSAWLEADGLQHYLCLRMRVVRAQVIDPWAVARPNN